MNSEYIFEWWHIPVAIAVFAIGVYLHSKIWDSYKYRNYNDSYKSKLKNNKKNKY